jgi:hypothetical protein
MTLLVQHLLVLLLVAGCAGFILWQSVLSLHGRKSKIGNCCAKGCSTDTAPKPPTPGTERVVFIPSDSLRARTPRRAPSEARPS